MSHALDGMTVVELLQKGKERIAGGWCRYAFMVKTLTGFAYCARGAVEALHHHQHPIVLGAERALAETIECQGHMVENENPYDVTSWRVP